MLHGIKRNGENCAGTFSPPSNPSRRYRRGRTCQRLFIFSVNDLEWSALPMKDKRAGIGWYSQRALKLAFWHKPGLLFRVFSECFSLSLEGCELPENFIKPSCNACCRRSVSSLKGYERDVPQETDKGHSSHYR